MGSERVWCRGPQAALLLVPTERSAAVPPKNPPVPLGSKTESAVERSPLAQTRAMTPSSVPVMRQVSAQAALLPVPTERSAAVLPKNPLELAVWRVQSAAERLPLARMRAMASVLVMWPVSARAALLLV